MLTVIKSRAMPVLMAAFFVLASAGAALADGNVPTTGGGSTGSTGIIDFEALARDILPLLTTAVQAAAAVGAVVLAATVCWRFFRRFIQG